MGCSNGVCVSAMLETFLWFYVISFWANLRHPDSCLSLSFVLVDMLEFF
nr:MAG TPA: hypothetical protein [Podoviridae sp. ctgx11]